MNHKEKGLAAFEGGGEARNKKLQTPRIIPFPEKKAMCRSCGIAFAPARPHHRLCCDCYGWHRIAENLAENQRLLWEVGQ